MKIHHYHPETLEYLETSEYKKVDGIGLPAFTTEIPPLPKKDNSTIIFNYNTNKWEYVVDYRGRQTYNKMTLEPSTVNTFGELFSTHTFLEPGSIFDVWDGEKWVYSEEKFKSSNYVATPINEEELIEELYSKLSHLEEIKKLGHLSKTDKQYMSDIKKYLSISHRSKISGIAHTSKPPVYGTSKKKRFWLF